MKSNSAEPLPATPWTLSGTYFEACNCDAICPCRVVGGASGGPSTDGVCEFALSWHIERGGAGGTDLHNLDVVLAGRYYDDPNVADGHELGKWEVALYLDESADRAQGAALESIFLGRAGGSTLETFAGAIDTVHAVRRARIDLIHEPRRKRISVADRVRVVAREPVVSDQPISCGISGHDHPGQEWIADVMSVQETGLHWEVTGKCSFAADFSYQSSEVDVASAQQGTTPGGNR